MGPEPTNRRGLLRALVQSAGQVFGDFTDAVNAGQDAAERAMPAPEPPAPPPELTQMAPVPRTLTMAEFDALVAEAGLEERREALRALVRPATRLTPTLGAGPNRSWIGPPAGPPVAQAVPDTAVTEATPAPVAEIDLADPALADGPLAGTGRLRVLIDTAAPAGPLEPCRRAELSVVEEPGPSPGRSVHLSTELTLPRVWAAPVQVLELDAREHDAYVRLRERVAEEQGVTAEDADAQGTAVHHVLGYPTETSGTMPLACELASRGLDPDMAPVDVPQDAAAAAERWRLLLQITQDAASRVTLGGGVTRLFFWIDGERLERRDFSEVWAIAR
jgi:Domain of unknown function (DUF1963)